MTSSTTAFVFFGGLGLSLINKRRIVRLSLIFGLVISLITVLPINIIFIFFDQQLIFFRALGIDFSSPKGWL